MPVGRLGDSGIIPAYAGSTLPFLSNLLIISDHPRIRGEHGVPASPGILERGSSPHTRGAPKSTSTPPETSGIIPAYAGSTRCSRRARWVCRDHPRIRGEHTMTAHSSGAAAGSSPHTRGARGGVHRHRRPGRIIPAYAGSTGSTKTNGSRTTDHPRIRGEHVCETVLVLLAERIIPAYAGSTASRSSSSCRAPDHPRIRGEH